MAKNEECADAILMSLVTEDILDYYELNGREDMPSDEIDGDYNAVVDDEGYLTLDTDIVGDLSDLVYRAHDNHIYGFVAEYLEG
jgi:hypothetical protein